MIKINQYKQCEKKAINNPSKVGGEIGEAESEISLVAPNDDEIQQDENEGKFPKFWSQHVPNHLQNCFILCKIQCISYLEYIIIHYLSIWAK